MRESIELDDYERDNLLAALEAIAHFSGPQAAMNNGDWVMQIAYKLGWAGEDTIWGRPNAHAEAMDRACRHRVVFMLAPAPGVEESPE